MGWIPRAAGPAVLAPLAGAVLGLGALSGAIAAPPAEREPAVVTPAHATTAPAALLRATAVPTRRTTQRVRPAITDPDPYDRVSGRMSFRAAWPVVRGVSRVELLLDGRVVDRMSPGSGVFAGATGWIDLRREDAGRTRFAVRVVYRDGDTAAVRRTVIVARPVAPTPAADTEGPAVEITAPAAGATVSGTVTVSASATDRGGVDAVEFLVDGEPVDEDASAPYAIRLDTTEYEDGPVTITARATDGAGNDASAARRVSVSNPLPDEPDIDPAPAPSLPPPPPPSIPTPTPPTPVPPTPTPPTPTPPTPTPPTPVPPTPPSAPAEIPGRITHRGDFETGNLTQWKGTHWVAPDRIQVVGSPVAQGSRAGRFEVRQGDQWQGSSGNRAELMMNTDEKEGQERWYSWRTMFSADYPSVSSGFQIFTQWHATVGGSQPMLIFYAGGNSIGFKTVESPSPSQPGSSVGRWSAPMNRGTWHTFRLRVKWSTDRATGFVELWHNGAKVVDHAPVAAIIPGYGVYMKQGLYRHASIAPTGVVYHDGLQVSIVE